MNGMCVIKIVLLSLFFIYPLSDGCSQEMFLGGSSCPEAFGAKGDGIHDDTKAIQAAIDSLERSGGGLLSLRSGVYLVSTIKLGVKTSIRGTGNGSTIIKQLKGGKGDCLVIPAHSAALKLSDFTIIGNNANCGLLIENSKGDKENHHYLYSKVKTDGLLQPYKWINIDNICIYHFEKGMIIEPHGFNINICNSTFSHNDIGVILKCTDSSLYNCYVTNNKRDGLILAGSNNKLSNVKSIFNGFANAKECGAIVVKGSRCQIVNCETQDNYGKGFIIEGQYNLISNCISNTDGYSREPKQYDPSVMACGFMVKGLYNSFSNCAVTNYNEKYGAVYHSPIIVEDQFISYYENIYDEIKVLISKDKLLFRKPFRNVQTLISKSSVENLNTTKIGDENYFVSKIGSENFIKDIDLHLNNLQLLVDFRSSNKKGCLVEIAGDKSMRLEFKNSSIAITWQDKQIAELALDNDADFNKDDIRLIVSFSQYKKKQYVSMIMYENTLSRGWIKKEIRQEINIPVTWKNKNIVKIGDKSNFVKRMVITQSPLPESIFMPYSNLNKIYDSAIIYVDSDACI